jgi:hypothetical protein
MITPDTKDWTWVIERPCPECGFVASTLQHDEVGDVIRENAFAWRSVLTREDVREPPNESTWSPLEYASHIRDVYRIYDARLMRMLTEDDPTYQNWDQDATALEENYAADDPATVADELAVAADDIAERFDTVWGAQWERTGTRSDGARFTIDSFSRYLVHDVYHHLYDVGYRR